MAAAAATAPPLPVLPQAKIDALIVQLRSDVNPLTVKMNHLETGFCVRWTQALAFQDAQKTVDAAYAAELLKALYVLHGNTTTVYNNFSNLWYNAFPPARHAVLQQPDLAKNAATMLYLSGQIIDLSTKAAKDITTYDHKAVRGQLIRRQAPVTRELAFCHSRPCLCALCGHERARTPTPGLQVQHRGRSAEGQAGEGGGAAGGREEDDGGLHQAPRGLWRGRRSCGRGRRCARRHRDGASRRLGTYRRRRRDLFGRHLVCCAALSSVAVRVAALPILDTDGGGLSCARRRCPRRSTSWRKWKEHRAAKAVERTKAEIKALSAPKASPWDAAKVNGLTTVRRLPRTRLGAAERERTP